MSHQTKPDRQSPPSPKPKLTICPYCGARCRSLAACENCRGKFDPLSRQATQNAMGPWFIRDETNPHRPGCSYETLVGLVARRKVTGDTVIRGPGSRQFWTLARWCPGVGHLLGVCHSCQRPVAEGATACGQCGASFVIPADRQALGLGEVRAVPGRAIPRQSHEHEDADEVTPAARPLAGDRPALPVGGPDPMTVRTQRELRRSRRWQTAWCAAFCVLAAVVLGALTLRVLDLDAGPVGRWIKGEKPSEPAISGGEPPTVTPITTPNLITGGSDAGEDPADDVAPTSGDQAGAAAEPAHDATGPSEPPPSPGNSPSAGETEAPSGGVLAAPHRDLGALAALRRLR